MFRVHLRQLPFNVVQLPIECIQPLPDLLLLVLRPCQIGAQLLHAMIQFDARSTPRRVHIAASDRAAMFVVLA